jgi:hypothetical protein
VRVSSEFESFTATGAEDLGLAAALRAPRCQNERTGQRDRFAAVLALTLPILTEGQSPGLAYPAG